MYCEEQDILREQVYTQEESGDRGTWHRKPIFIMDLHSCGRDYNCECEIQQCETRILT